MKATLFRRIYLISMLMLSYHLRLQVVCFLQVLPPKAYTHSSFFLWVTFISPFLIWPPE